MEKKSIGILLGLGLAGVIIYFVFFNNSSSGSSTSSGSGSSGGSSGSLGGTGAPTGLPGTVSTHNYSGDTTPGPGSGSSPGSGSGGTITSSNGNVFDITKLNPAKKSDIGFVVTPASGQEGTVSLGNANDYSSSTILSQIQHQTPYSLGAYVTGQSGNQHQLYGINNFKSIGTENGVTGTLTTPLASFKGYLNGISMFLSKNTKTLPTVTATGGINGNNTVTINNLVAEPFPSSANNLLPAGIPTGFESNVSQKGVPTGLVNIMVDGRSNTAVYDYATATAENQQSTTITYQPSEFASAVSSLLNAGNQNKQSSNVLTNALGNEQVGASEVANAVGTGLADIGGSVTGFFKGLGL